MALSYEDAGVSIHRGDALVQRIKPLAKATRTPLVVDDVGGFAGLCGLPGDIDDPVLVSGTDGVGTKLKVAMLAGKHDTIGQDLVAMCVNDILTLGARPLFFLDYFACDKLDVDLAEQVVKGIADGCKLAQCALLGGETAEHPNMHSEGEYDVAGFAVGVASRKKLLGPGRVKVGDELIAIRSSGLHSNGYSLVRKIIFDKLGLSVTDAPAELGKSVAEELLTPTRIYTPQVQVLQQALGADLHALCHITGGGFTENIPRMLNSGQKAQLQVNHPRPAIFDFLQKSGPVEESEMRKTFNLGVGLVACVSQGQTDQALEALKQIDEEAWRFGTVVAETESKPSVEYV